MLNAIDMFVSVGVPAESLFVAIDERGGILVKASII